MVMADSEETAVISDLTFVFTAESLASCVYPESAKNPTVANMARIVTTTMSSAKVKARKNFFPVFAKGYVFSERRAFRIFEKNRDIKASGSGR